MRTLWILSGPSGVGKSTWIKNHMSFFLGKTAVVSRDAIRFSILKEGDSYFAHEKEVFRSFINAIIYSLNNYEHTIVDATHLNENSRRKLINSIGSENLKEISINVICLNASLGNGHNVLGLIKPTLYPSSLNWSTVVLTILDTVPYETNTNSASSV